MERVFGIQRQPADLCGSVGRWIRDGSGFGTIAVESQTSEGGCGQLDWIPLEYNRCLRGIPNTQDGF